MNENPFEPYQPPELGRRIARGCVSVARAFKRDWRAAFGWLHIPAVEGLPSGHYMRFVFRLGWFLAPFWVLLIVVLSLLAASLFMTHFAEIGATVDEADRRWLYVSITATLAALGGLVFAPFALIRVWLNERQAVTAEQGLITDRITKAVEQLGAEKTVQRQRQNRAGKLVYKKRADGQPDYSEPVYETVTVANLEVRLGAIYALERIAQDSERDHIPIMETLSAYIRQNAQQGRGEPPRFPLRAPKDSGPEELWSEADRLDMIRLRARNWSDWRRGPGRPRPPRDDIAAVLSVFARRSEARRAHEAEA